MKDNKQPILLIGGIALFLIGLIGGVILTRSFPSQDGKSPDPTISPTNSSSPWPTTAPANQTETIKLYFIAIGDNGKSGEEVGCNDSVVAYNHEIRATQTPLSDSIKELLSQKSRMIEGSNLYNSLYQSDLSLTNASIENGKAIIHLVGNLSLGGACDSPRVKAQIENTALQFQTVNSVQIYLNEEKLEDILSQK